MHASHKVLRGGLALVLGTLLLRPALAVPPDFEAAQDLLEQVQVATDAVRGTSSGEGSGGKATVEDIRKAAETLRSAFDRLHDALKDDEKVKKADPETVKVWNAIQKEMQQLRWAIAESTAQHFGDVSENLNEAAEAGRGRDANRKPVEVKERAGIEASLDAAVDVDRALFEGSKKLAGLQGSGLSVQVPGAYGHAYGSERKKPIPAESEALDVELDSMKKILNYYDTRQRAEALLKAGKRDEAVKIMSEAPLLDKKATAEQLERYKATSEIVNPMTHEGLVEVWGPTSMPYQILNALNREYTDFEIARDRIAKAPAVAPAKAPPPVRTAAGAAPATAAHGDPAAPFLQKIDSTIDDVLEKFPDPGEPAKFLPSLADLHQEIIDTVVEVQDAAKTLPPPYDGRALTAPALQRLKEADQLVGQMALGWRALMGEAAARDPKAAAQLAAEADQAAGALPNLDGVKALQPLSMIRGDSMRKMLIEESQRLHAIAATGGVPVVPLAGPPKLPPQPDPEKITQQNAPPPPMLPADQGRLFKEAATAAVEDALGSFPDPGEHEHFGGALQDAAAKMQDTADEINEAAQKLPPPFDAKAMAEPHLKRLEDGARLLVLVSSGADLLDQESQVKDASAAAQMAAQMDQIAKALPAPSQSKGPQPVAVIRAGRMRAMLEAESPKMHALAEKGGVKVVPLQALPQAPDLPLARALSSIEEAPPKQASQQQETPSQEDDRASFVAPTPEPATQSQHAEQAPTQTPSQAPKQNPADAGHQAPAQTAQTPPETVPVQPLEVPPQEETPKAQDPHVLLCKQGDVRMNTLTREDLSSMPILREAMARGDYKKLEKFLRNSKNHDTEAKQRVVDAMILMGWDGDGRALDQKRADALYQLLDVLHDNSSKKKDVWRPQKKSDIDGLHAYILGAFKGFFDCFCEVQPRRKDSLERICGEEYSSVGSVRRELADTVAAGRGEMPQTLYQNMERWLEVQGEFVKERDEHGEKVRRMKDEEKAYQDVRHRLHGDSR